MIYNIGHDLNFRLLKLPWYFLSIWAGHINLTIYITCDRPLVSTKYIHIYTSTYHIGAHPMLCQCNIQKNQSHEPITLPGSPLTWELYDHESSDRYTQKKRWLKKTIWSQNECHKRNHYSWYEWLWGLGWSRHRGPHIWTNSRIQTDNLSIGALIFIV